MMMERVHDATSVRPLRSIFLIAGLLLAMAPIAASAQPSPSTLKSVEVNALSGDRVRLDFEFEGKAPQHDSFTISDPARIVVDFPATRSEVAQRFRRVDIGLIESVTVSEAGSRTRATVKLSALGPYDISRQGNTLQMTMNAGGNVPLTTRGAQSAPMTGQPDDVSIDFRRGTEGQGVVSMSLPGDSVNIDVREEGDRIIIDLPGIQVPTEQERRLDVLDFATPVKLVDMFNHSGGARLVVVTVGPHEYLAYQAGNQYTLEVKPLVPEQSASADTGQRRKKSFEGEPLSLNFQDIEVRAVLQILADFTGLNVVVSDSVGGNLTLRLKNVPWDQALDIILQIKGLSMRENGSVLLIAPTEEIAAREKLELEAQQQTVELEPLRTDLIQINYAKANEIGDLLKSSESSMLSPRGSITVDARTNTLLVQDIASKISEMRKLVAQLDVPVRQVLIDSRVVIASNDFTKELGIKWGGAFKVSTGGGPTGYGTAGRLPGAEQAGADAVTGTPLSAGNIPLAQQLGVNLGTLSNPFGSIGLAILGTDFLLSMELSALQAEGLGEVLSNPRVITTNRKTATIEQGVEIPYQEASSSGATSVSFKKAVLSLEVTPQITPNDRIIMDLNVKKDSVGENVPSGTEGGFIPSIDTREVTTQVLVSDGETVVLGGIYEREQSKDIDKVPFLGDLPGIGALFRRTLTQDDKAELLIFVTPRIVREALGTLQ